MSSSPERTCTNCKQLVYVLAANGSCSECLFVETPPLPPTTLEDVYTKLVEMHDELRTLTSAVDKLQVRLDDIEAAREYTAKVEDEQAHVESVLASGHPCHCQVCDKHRAARTIHSWGEET